MSKYQKTRAQELQREQLRLVKVESILTKLLGQVNESINELKVEELHIKSSLIEHYTVDNHNDEEPSTSAQAALRLKSSSLPEVDPLNIQMSENAMDMEGIEDINKQILALESLLVPIKPKKFDEEEEEDDDGDDDDDYNPAKVSASEEEEDEYDVKTRLKNICP